MKNDRERKPGSVMQSGGSGSVGRSPGSASGPLDKETQSKIGQQLRAMYDDVVRQGVPDRFSELLKRLERNDDEEPKS